MQAGSGATTLGVPTSPGVPKGTAADTLIARYNDPASVTKLLRAHRGRVAAVIVEPVAGNMGVVPPAEGFLQGLRAACDEHGALLIFDEVISGFRMAKGGAQAVYGVRPDLTCLGKIIGGGLPVGAYGGRADLMDRMSPAGPVYQAGTLSGNPLAMTAGIWALTNLTAPLYRRLAALGARLADGLRAAAAAAGVPLTVNVAGSVLTPFFHPGPVTDYASATAADTAAYGARSSTACSRAASTRPRRSSRGGSCRPPTPSATSTGRSAPPARRSAKRAPGRARRRVPAGASARVARPAARS